MALNFPNSPIDGQTFTSGTTTWTYNATVGGWKITSSGPTGYTGSAGYVGSQGVTGYDGSRGSLGYTGSKGDIGYTGSLGATGYVGSFGYTGSKGDLGYTGSQGVTGYSGSKGDTGYVGSTGPIGGANTEVLFNDQGTANGSPNFTYNKGTSELVLNGSLNITGNIYFSNVMTIVSNNIVTSDNMFYLNSGSVNNNPDLGFAGNYNDGIYHHAGFFRDATDGVWKVYDSYLPEPDASIYIDTANASFRIADFQSNTLYTRSISANGSIGTAGQVLASDGSTVYWSTNPGYAGSKGDTGYTGSQGNLGYVGSKGDIGYTGSKGDIGYTGSKGDLGYTGSKGDIGYTGSKGDTGYTGSKGDIGYTGSKGDIGYTGSWGGTAVANVNMNNFSINNVDTLNSARITTTASGAAVALTNTSNNWISWTVSGTGAPTYTTRSAGTKLLLYPQLGAGSADYAIGIEGNHLWFGAGSTTNGFRWYCGTTNIMIANTSGLYMNTSGFIANPTFLGYTETEIANTATTGTYTMDCTASNFWELTLTGNTTISAANVPANGRVWTGTIAAKQDATGGRTITWPAGTKYAGGITPPATTAANALDLWSLMTYDGGSSWIVSLSVKDAK